MKFFIENWYVFVISAVVLAFIITGIVMFFKMPRKKQIEVIKKWLLFAVTKAEKELGSGTGQLKLRYVYDMFIERFWYLSSVITFEMVSELVDEALEEMRKMLETNKKVAEYVEVDKGEKDE